MGRRLQTEGGGLSHPHTVPDAQRLGGVRIGPWIGPALCAGVALAWAWGHLAPNPEGPQEFAPDWLPLIAAAIAAAAMLPHGGSPRWRRLQVALRWTGLL